MEVLTINRSDFNQIHSFRFQQQLNVCDSISIQRVRFKLYKDFNYPMRMCEKMAKGIVEGGEILMCNRDHESDSDSDCGCEAVNEIGGKSRNTAVNAALCISSLYSTQKESYVFDLYPSIHHSHIVRTIAPNYATFIEVLKDHIHNFNKIAFNATVILLNIHTEDKKVYYLVLKLYH